MLNPSRIEIFDDDGVVGFPVNISEKARHSESVAKSHRFRDRRDFSRDKLIFIYNFILFLSCASC